MKPLARAEIDAHGPGALIKGKPAALTVDVNHFGRARGVAHELAYAVCAHVRAVGCDVGAHDGTTTVVHRTQTDGGECDVTGSQNLRDGENFPILVRKHDGGIFLQTKDSNLAPSVRTHDE